MDGMDGIGSPGGRGYRAPYGANKWQRRVKESIKAVANERHGPFQGHSEDRMST